MPGENGNNVYAKFWRTKKEYYGIFESALFDFHQNNINASAFPRVKIPNVCAKAQDIGAYVKN